jgi:hypothetical protein
VRAEAEAARAAWRDDLDRQYDEVEAALRRGAAAVLSDALRRGWRELADEDLEARALETFGRRLREIDDATRAALADAAASGPVVVTTAFEPTEGSARSWRRRRARRAGRADRADLRARRGAPGRRDAARGRPPGGWSVRAHVDELERTWREAIGPDGPSEAAPGAPSEPEAPALPAGERDAGDRPRLADAVGDEIERLGRLAEAWRPALALDEVGIVASVGGGIAAVRGLPGVRADEVVRFAGGEEGLALDLRRDDVGVVLLGSDAGVRAGTEVARTGRVLDVPVGDALLGRVVDPLGSPRDDGGPVRGAPRWPVERPAAPIVARSAVRTRCRPG